MSVETKCAAMTALIFTVIACLAWSEPTAAVPTKWHPGFVEAVVEMEDPTPNWTPTAGRTYNKKLFSTHLINTEHIVDFDRYRGDTRLTPRTLVTLSTGKTLLVAVDYDDMKKLIRSSWAGLGKLK